jgi:hypothetical protein
MIAVLLVLTQSPPPTVGDTIWIERSVAIPAGAEVRAARWDPEGTVELLGRPVVRRQGDSATVSYPAVAWSAGTHTVLVPGPIVIGSDGVTDSLPLEARSLVVASVLPEGQAPEQLSVQPEAGLVNERVTSPWLLVASLALAALVLSPFVWWWRRRGPPMNIIRPATGRAIPSVVEWMEAGEYRAVAAAAARALRSAITSRLPGSAPGLVTSRLVRVMSEQRSTWPADEIGSVLRALEAAKFAETPAQKVVELVERATELRRRIEEAA